LGNFAPVVTTGIVLFNVFIFILISAFAMDDVAIGQASNVEIALNSSGEGVPSTIQGTSFLSRFTISLFDILPWWVSVFVLFVNLILIPITILAWVRGL